jgi:hypothetical protein
MPTNPEPVSVTQAERIATTIADRCHGSRKPNQARERYAIIWQAARMGALEALTTLSPTPSAVAEQKPPAEVYQSAADCPLGAAHGMASTFGGANGERCCDFCGFPVESLGEVKGLVDQQPPAEVAGLVDLESIERQFSGSVAWANEPDDYHHLVTLTPPQLEHILREAITRQAAQLAERDAEIERVTWFRFEPSNGEWSGEYCSVKPHDSTHFVPMIRLDALARRDAEIAGLKREIGEAREIILDLAESLEPEVRDRWCYVEGRPHPGLQHKFDRDMAPVDAARAFLARQGEQP